MGGKSQGYDSEDEVKAEEDIFSNDNVVANTGEVISLNWFDATLEYTPQNLERSLDTLGQEFQPLLAEKLTDEVCQEMVVNMERRERKSRSSWCIIL